MSGHERPSARADRGGGWGGGDGRGAGQRVVRPPRGRLPPRWPPPPPAKPRRRRQIDAATRDAIRRRPPQRRPRRKRRPHIISRVEWRSPPRRSQGKLPGSSGDCP